MGSALAGHIGHEFVKEFLGLWVAACVHAYVPADLCLCYITVMFLC